VSACLLGLCTRCDGGHKLRRDVVDGLCGLWGVPVCPEQLGGLPTPRAPAEIVPGADGRAADGRDVVEGRARVVSRDGADVTDCYLRGARETLRLAELLGARRAILKEGSPACGVCRIKRGEADVPGAGVTAALLLARGVRCEGIE